MKRKLLSPTLSGLATLLILSTGAPTSLHAANAYAVKSGNWDEEIWSSSGKGLPEPGVRPGEGEYDSVQFRQNGIRVAVHTDVGSVNQLFLNNTGTPTVLRLNAGARLNVQFLALAAGGGKSLLEVSGDSVLTVGDTGVRVAHEVNGVGTLNISEGTMTVNGKFILSGKEASGTVNLASGTLAVPFIEAGMGTGIFSWTGGTLQSGGADVEKIENSSGVLDIGGPQSSSGGGFIHKGKAPVYQQGAGGVMRIEISNAKTYEHFESDGPSGQVILGGTIEIHPINGYQPRTGEFFDIVTAAKIVDEGVTLGGPAGARFQAVVVDKGMGQALRITAK